MFCGFLFHYSVFSIRLLFCVSSLWTLKPKRVSRLKISWHLAVFSKYLSSFSCLESFAVCPAVRPASCWLNTLYMGTSKLTEPQKPSGSIWSTSERTNLMPFRQMYNGPNQMRNPNNMLGSFHREARQQQWPRGYRCQPVTGRSWLKSSDPLGRKSGTMESGWGKLPLPQTTGMVPLEEEHAGITRTQVEDVSFYSLHMKTTRMLLWDINYLDKIYEITRINNHVLDLSHHFTREKQWIVIRIK